MSDPPVVPRRRGSVLPPGVGSEGGPLAGESRLSRPRGSIWGLGATPRDRRGSSVTDIGKFMSKSLSDRGEKWVPIGSLKSIPQNQIVSLKKANDMHASGLFEIHFYNYSVS